MAVPNPSEWNDQAIDKLINMLSEPVSINTPEEAIAQFLSNVDFAIFPELEGQVFIVGRSVRLLKWDSATDTPEYFPSEYVEWEIFVRNPEDVGKLATNFGLIASINQNGVVHMVSDEAFQRLLVYNDNLRNGYKALLEAESATLRRRKTQK